MQLPIPPSLYDLTREQLTDRLAEWGEPVFRARQIWHWLYQRLADSIDAMTDLPRALRDRLKQTYALGRMTAVAEQHSSDGWTRKWLFRLADGSEIETVLMEYDGLRRTACVSSQAGCAMDCSFCATGQMGFLRNLRAGEIVEQVIWVARALRAKTDGDERLSNLVLMGMGEPFANYNNVMEAIHRLMSPEAEGGFGLGARKITVSTVGLVPGIRRFAEESVQVNLAVSLHAATDALRNQLVPINRRYPLRELVSATRDYLRKTNRRVSYEWAMIDGVNDTVEQAEALVELVRQTNPRPDANLVHVNMIPLNPTGGYAGRASRRARIEQFRDVLARAGIPNTLRVRRGIDISAGCGQLKAETAQAAPEKQTSG
ncbi:MAG: 23S rRNA (adenine(2503)-C(2))-methyltransferase RlmN [Thermoflexales bacterium]|nr:23S rRNA (adenine(2503)-C(2))-methyltransferase RlmN [Thermoflexales bacterium]MDW8351709.1 23S rRNA (adenine(2503)-C(2))-methyltransferase RlmN [Anaerolineae bacterium]